MNALEVITFLAIWATGSIVIILLLCSVIQYLAWRLYKDIVGWPVIAKAMKAYRQSIKDVK